MVSTSKPADTVCPNGSDGIHLVSPRPPFSVWITARFEDQGSGGANDLLLPKVELITGGTLGEQWSYFAEWRIVSLSLNSDRSLNDRGGAVRGSLHPAEHRHASGAEG